MIFLACFILFLDGCGGGSGDADTKDFKPIEFLFPDAKDASDAATENDLLVDPGKVDLTEEASPEIEPPPDLGTDDPGAPDLAPDDTAPDEWEPPDHGPKDSEEPLDIIDNPDIPPDLPKCSPDGSPCDDKDPCTINDGCYGGQCKGAPVTCPDDGYPCTTHTCVAGTCLTAIAPGFCLIDGMCLNDGQKDPANACLICAALTSQKDWTSQEGALCDDGNACTDPDTCQGGKCTPGPDKCGPPTCTYHEDCYPEKVCGVWYKDGSQRCSTPCGGMADCAAGETCTGMPGSANVGYCQPFPKAEALPVGGKPCNNGWDCQSALCLMSTCGTVCSGQPGCPAGHTCQAAGDPVLGFGGACFPDAGTSAIAMGLQCTKDGKVYDSALCRSGHCDLFQAKATCTPLCWTDTQCAPSQECNIVIYSQQPIAESVPYAKVWQQKTHDAVLGCFSQQPGGGQTPTGSVCNQPSDCKTSKCMALVPNNPAKYCTTFCATDADCPASMKCKLDATTLVSVWLANYQVVGGQSPKADGYTLVRICKPK